VRKQWPDESTYLAYVHTVLYDIALKAYLFYHLCCVGIMPAMFPARSRSPDDTFTSNAPNQALFSANGSRDEIPRISRLLPSASRPRASSASSHVDPPMSQSKVPPNSHMDAPGRVRSQRFLAPSPQATTVASSSSAEALHLTLAALDPASLSSSFRGVALSTSRLSASSFAKKFSLQRCDLEILERLAEVIKEQQQQEIGMHQGEEEEEEEDRYEEPSPPTIHLDYSLCQTLKNNIVPAPH